MRTGTYRLGLGLITATALAVRVAYTATVTRHQPIMMDEVYYTGTAHQFVSGDGFTSFGFPEPAGTHLADHPPLTSLVLAPWVWLTGVYGDMPRYVMAVLGAVVVLLIARIADEVGGRRVSLVAAGLAAVYPNLWVNDGLLMSETLAALTTALVVWLALRLRRGTATVAAAALAGICVGASGLARAELLLFLPLLVVPVVLTLPDEARGRRLRLAGVATLACAVTVAPWIAYNVSRFDEPVLMSLDGGTLLGANCDLTYYGPETGTWNGYCTIRLPGGDASDDSVAMRRAAFTYMGDHVGRLPAVAAARVGRLWSVFRPFDPVDRYAAEGRPRWISTTGVLSLWVVAGLAVAGGASLRRRGGGHLLVLLSPLVVVTAVSVVAYGRERFRVPAEVALIVLAALAVERRLPAAPPGPVAEATEPEDAALVGVSRSA